MIEIEREELIEIERFDGSKIDRLIGYAAGVDGIRGQYVLIVIPYPAEDHDQFVDDLERAK